MDVESDVPGVPDYIFRLTKDFPAELQANIKTWLKAQFEDIEIPTLAVEIMSSDFSTRLHGLIGIRKLLGNESAPPIQPVIDTGVIPFLIQFMKMKDQPYLQLEAAWALTNVASGTSIQAQYVVMQGGVDLFIELLSSEVNEIVEQAIWGLGNIAGDSAVLRDLLLEKGLMNILLHIIQTTNHDSNFQNGIWVISNLCRGQPKPKLELVAPAAPVLLHLLPKCTKSDARNDAAWALAFLAAQSSDEHMVIPPGELPAILSYACKEEKGTSMPFWKLLANIVNQSESQANLVFNLPDFLPSALSTLQGATGGYTNKSLLKEITSILSALATSSSPQKELFFTNLEWIVTLLSITTSPNIDMSKNAVHVLTDLAKGCNTAQVKVLFEAGVLERFVTLLGDPPYTNEAAVAKALLEAVQAMLENAPVEKDGEPNPYLECIEANNGVAYIEELQHHPDELVYQKTVEILEKFFSVESEP